jgi:hypothetical protein
MWWLVGGHARVDLEAIITVSCKICGQVYDALWQETTQGHDICATSKRLPDGRWVIHCGYPSAYDLSEFWYIDQIPSEEVDGICDWCIGRMVRDGVIINSGIIMGPHGERR